MSFTRRARLCWTIILLSLNTVASAQRHPHIGYVYPAGARRGAELEVTVGGQFLSGTSEARINGGDVRVEVVDYTKPLSQEEANALRQKLRELGRRLEVAKKKSGDRVKAAKPALIERIARDVGLDVTEAKGVAALRAKLSRSRRQLNLQIAEKVLLRIRIDSDARVGERELRLRTTAGVSNPIRFHIGGWSEHREAEPNQKVAERVVTTERPIILNGQISPGDVDRFRFHARKGERLVVAASARQLIPYLADAVPGWFQATLALRDAAGREVAYADDYRFHPDPVLLYEVPDDGQYEIEIKDAIYRGREDFVYRIALGELPFVTSFFPLGGRAGRETTVDLDGWNLPESRLTVSAEAITTGIRELSVGDGGPIPRRVPFAVDTLPECREKEPNGTALNAQSIQLPCIVNGRVGRPGDRDVFRFEGSAGDEIVVEVKARRLDSPLDSLLEITHASGKRILSNDDYEDKGAGLTTHHADSRMTVTIPATGEYLCRLSDTQKKGGIAYAYRLRVSRRQPDFALRVVPSSVNAAAGSTVPVTVYALRKDGFAENIALRLKGAPSGFSLSGGWVPSGLERVELTLTIPPNASGDLVALRLEGSAIIGGRELRRQAVPTDDEMQAFIYRHLVPAKEWVVAATQRGKRRGGVRLVDEGPVELRVGEATRVRISSPRAGIFRQVQLELRDPPEGVTLRRVSAERDGAVLVFGVAAGKVRPGLEGNLIVQAFSNGRAKSKKTKGKRKARRFLLDTLPAIPFAVVTSRETDSRAP